MIRSRTTVSNMIFSPMICFASDTDDAYVKGMSTTYPITFPTSAGTVYGGTLTINADGSGELVVDKTEYTVSGAEITAVGGGTETSIMFARTAGLTGTIYDRNAGALMCDQYPVVNAVVTDTSEIGIRFHTNGYVYIYNAAFTDLETAKSILNASPVHVLLKLITPTRYQLTADQISEILTLYGENNIWADCGDVTVTYGAYLETVKKHADVVGDSILSAIAPLEASYTASRAYAVGEFLFVGTTFYKVTAPISSGDIITPGTNVTQTTVAAQLMELAGN